MVMQDKRKEYLKEYRKKNIRRIPLDVDHDFYIRVQQHAYSDGRSVNGYIKRVLTLAMDREDRESAGSASEEKQKSVRQILMAMNDNANKSNV